MSNEIRPLTANIKSASHKQLLYGEKGPSIDELEKVVEESATSKDRTAEAIARFWLASYYDGNTPGLEKLDHRRAINELDKVISLFPDWREAHFNRAVAYLHNKEFTAAIAEFDLVEERCLEARGPDIGSPSSQNDEILLGKLYLFRAEARTKRKYENDLAKARHEINQAIVWLKNKRSGPFWLKQIPRRLEATFSSQLADKSGLQILDSVSVFTGLASTGFLLFVFFLVFLLKGCAFESAPKADNKLDIQNNKIQSLLHQKIVG